jgi:hypothetical protein
MQSLETKQFRLTLYITCSVNHKNIGEQNTITN